MGRRPSAEGCSPRERDFVNGIVLNGLSKRQAAISAGVPEASASQQATEMLAKASVQEYMRDLKSGQDALVRSQTGETAAAIIEQMGEIALANPADAFNEDGTIKPIEDWPEELQRSLVSMDIKELWFKNEFGEREQAGRIIKIRFHDKQKAADLVLKVQGAYAPIQHQHVSATLSELLEASKGMPAVDEPAPPPPVQGPVVDAELDEDED